MDLMKSQVIYRFNSQGLQTDRTPLSLSLSPSNPVPVLPYQNVH